MIPKIIHYCWFGGDKPAEVIKYIDGWKKLCPDYEIKEWNEKNFDISQSKFAFAAYKEKKWAFVSDYARFFILEKYGGIYLDTDIELIKNLDSLLNDEAFIGFEVHGVAAGVIGSKPHNPIICAILKTYDRTDFYLDNGKLNLLTSPDYFTNEILKVGFVRENKKQQLKNITVYPSEYFYPYSTVTFATNITNNTYAIHHYSGTWLDEKTKYQLYIQKKIIRFFGKRLSVWIAVSISELKFNGFLGLLKAVSERGKRK